MRGWLLFTTCLLIFTTPTAASAQADAPLKSHTAEFSVELVTMQKGYDGKDCWVHARAGVIPLMGQADPLVVLTAQKLQLTGSDVFYAIHSSHSSDAGDHWTPLAPQAPFKRRTVGNAQELTVCDFTPQWHAKSRKLLGIGQTVQYQNNRVMHVRNRDTAYAVYDPETHAWNAWRPLLMPDEPRFRSCGAGSVQRWDLENGDVLLPVYFKEPEATQYSVTVVRCHFDGTQLTYVEHGNEMTINHKRGLYEPSLIHHAGRFYLTLRNDDSGYIATSDDGLHFSSPQPWKFDDGTSLGNYNTQQHWVSHGENLYLVYTRKGLNNDHVFRHRAPLLMAQVDTNTTTVIRSTEKTLVPERGARLGNFGVTQVGPDEVWVTVTEWMQTWGPDIIIPPDNPRGADNSIFIAKIKWASE